MFKHPRAFAPDVPDPTQLPTRGAGVGQTLDFGLFLAGSILMTLPMALIFIFFQRYFVEGVSHTAVKG